MIRYDNGDTRCNDNLPDLPVPEPTDPQPTDPTPCPGETIDDKII